jgi:ATP-binding cassette subfamily C protein
MTLARFGHRSVELVGHSKERAAEHTRAAKRFLYQLMQRVRSANRVLDIDGSSRIEHPFQGGKSQYVSAAAQMDAWRVVVWRNLAIVFVFSIFVNLLMLTLPIYLFQLSDRVLTSHSIETLLMLTGLALGFIAVLSLLDILRRQILGRLAMKLEALLGGAVLTSIVNSGRAGESGNVHLLRKLQQVRSFISSPVMLLLIDGPLAPVYFGVTFLIHPDLGWIAVISGLLLLAIALLNQRATAEPLGRASLFASKADGAAESLARNSQVINAMGMLNESILTWGRQQARSLIVQAVALDRNLWISGASKFIRLSAQILILGWGAHLALSGQLTGGMMIAASIIAGRGLQPLEGLIEGWRSFVQTREAYLRVRNAVESQRNDEPKLLLPRPTGQLSVDRVLYIPPGSKEPVLNGIAFTLEPGESLEIGQGELKGLRGTAPDPVDNQSRMSALGH